MSMAPSLADNNKNGITDEQIPENAGSTKMPEDASGELVVDTIKTVGEEGTALTRELEGTGVRQVVIEIGDFTFDALSAGPENGTPVMLLHGFPSTNYQWRSQIIALAAAGYNVFAPNQRGYSPQARPLGVDNYTSDFLVGDIHKIAKKLKWDRFHLVGHDWGAFVAWSYGGAYPDQLISLTPISVPHPEAFAIALADPSGTQSGMSSYMDFFRTSGSEDAFIANDAELLRGIYESANLSPSEMEPYLEVLGTPDAIGAALNWYRANDFSPELDVTTGRRTTIPDINLPTMYVWSTEDTALGKQGADLTSNFITGDYRYEIIEGVNHWVTEVAAEELNGALISFFATYSSSS